MFIIAQLPLSDFRPLIRGGKGRLSVPDWASGNLDSGFVKGSALIEEVRFAIDPLAERGGFEPLVPPERTASSRPR